MYTWIYIILAIILFITALVGLNTQQSKAWMVISRIAYVLLVIEGIIAIFQTFGNSPVWNIIRIIAAIVLIWAVEYGFSKKNQNQVTQGITWTVAIVIIVVFIIGFIAASGTPFI